MKSGLGRRRDLLALSGVFTATVSVTWPVSTLVRFEIKAPDLFWSDRVSVAFLLFAPRAKSNSRMFFES